MAIRAFRRLVILVLAVMAVRVAPVIFLPIMVAG
jgi:hypothetical protein